MSGGEALPAGLVRRFHEALPSARLHHELSSSEFIVLPGLGHMIHHLAPDAVVDAIDRVAERGREDRERADDAESGERDHHQVLDDSCPAMPQREARVAADVPIARCTRMVRRDIEGR